jgi:hypothetical protein
MFLRVLAKKNADEVLLLLNPLLKIGDGYPSGEDKFPLPNIPAGSI